MSSATKDSEALPRFQQAWLALGWLMVLAIGLGSLWPTLPSAAAPFSDKLLHFGAYTGLAFVFAGALGRERWLRVGLGLLLLGMVVELLQHYLTDTRSGEWADLGANVAGVSAGLLLAAMVPGNWCRRVEIALGAVGRGGS